MKLPRPRHPPPPTLNMVPGCSKCLFMYEAGERAGQVVSSFVGWVTWWDETAAEPETLPGENTAEGTGFCTFVFDRGKKELAVRG